MLKNQRHVEILEILKNQSFASVHELGERLYASQPTIRRDLDILEKQGYIRRSHGGAMLADDKGGAPVSFRRGTKTQEKMRICRLAATLINAGDVIFIDASTTASYLADHIRESDGVIVVSNGYQVCRTLVENNVKIFSTGGRMLRDSMAFAGRFAEKTVSEFNADIMFFSCSGLNMDGVISDYSEEEISLRHVMHSRAKNTVFLCDSGKFGGTSAFREFLLSELDYVVTDEPLPAEILKKSSFILALESDGAYLYKNSDISKSDTDTDNTEKG
ncbi:MAG: DeoR/GlpR transcriptional regulator [Clostridia bacterium]|nr:DeoR/GlpR transcriptional regulator [Clostridia bacterium]